MDDKRYLKLIDISAFLLDSTAYYRRGLRGIRRVQESAPTYLSIDEDVLFGITTRIRILQPRIMLNKNNLYVQIPARKLDADVDYMFVVLKMWLLIHSRFNRE